MTGELHDIHMHNTILQSCIGDPSQSEVRGPLSVIQYPPGTKAHLYHKPEIHQFC